MDAIEIVYVWPNGREEVRYVRQAGTDDAQRLIDDVEKLRASCAASGEVCPYSYRRVITQEFTNGNGRAPARTGHRSR